MQVVPEQISVPAAPVENVERRYQVIGDFQLPGASRHLGVKETRLSVALDIEISQMGVTVIQTRGPVAVIVT